MTQNHIHQYIRDQRNKRRFRCKAPDCTHFSYSNLLDGKTALCNSCRREFILTKYNLRTAIPKCLNCSNHKAAKERQIIAAAPEVQALYDSMLVKEEEEEEVK